MNGFDLAVLAGSCAAGALLLSSGITHARDWKRLLSSLLKHDVLPYGIARAVARILPSSQVIIAAWLLASLVIAGDSFYTRASLVATAMLFAAMTVYLGWVVVTVPEASCTCFGREQPLNWVSVLRAALLTVAPLIAALAGITQNRSDLAMGVGAGTVVATLLAMAPSMSTTRRFA